MIDRAAGGVLAGNYPPYRKLIAAVRRAEAGLAANPDRLGVAVTGQITADLDVARLLLADAAKDGAPRPLLYEAASVMYASSVRLLGDHEKAFDSVRAALDAAVPGTNLPQLFAAETFLARVRAIRENRDALQKTFNPAGKARAAGALLDKAKAAIDAAIELDPQDPVPLDNMLRYLTESEAPRDQFEEYFAKAMAVYPNNLRACQLKRAYLQGPGGTAHPQEAIAFGRECLAGANWSSRIPLIIVDVHGHIARFDRPEEHYGRAEVWEDIRGALEPYLKRYPNAVYDRSHYARLACHAGKWDVAHAQFERLGDNGVYNFFRGKPTYDYYREKAARLASTGQ
jgi:tetratricopeptide (TPR) repeat protein